MPVVQQEQQSHRLFDLSAALLARSAQRSVNGVSGDEKPATSECYPVFPQRRREPGAAISPDGYSNDASQQ
jgi:hypothetical protein